MDEKEKAGELVSLDDVRLQRMIEEMIEEGLKNLIEPSINLLGKTLLPFVSLAGGEDLSQTHLRIVLNDVSSGHSAVAGAISLNPPQWELLKEQIDQMIEAHIRALAKNQSS